MKALDKERNRRYETANDFAADIERFLNDEPISPCPPRRPIESESSCDETSCWSRRLQPSPPRYCWVWESVRGWRCARVEPDRSLNWNV